MKSKTLIFLVGLLLLPIQVFAISKPIVTNIPDKIDADFFTLKIEVDEGAKVTVVGGLSNIPPITDGEGGDTLDGKVEVMVGLAQNSNNVFSINAQKNGDFSDSMTVSIKEEKAINSGGGSSQGDVTPPEAPVVDEVISPITDTEIILTGSTESDANVYVRDTNGVKLGSTQANSKGIFSVTVDLKAGKTNRLNVSAEDAAYNEGRATQVVIQVLEPVEAEKKAEKKPIKKVIQTPKASALPFVDLKDHWAKSFVQKIYERNIVNGKSDTRFAPNDNITRAELIKVALKAFNHKVKTSVDSTSFKDVKKTDWYAVFIEKARELKIVNGYDDGFRPNQSISRAAALKILLEASGLELGDGIVEFSDVKSNDWFRKYVSFAKSNKIVGGYSDGTFRPNATITRAEVAKIVLKIIELKEGNSTEPII